MRFDETKRIRNRLAQRAAIVDTTGATMEELRGRGRLLSSELVRDARGRDAPVLADEHHLDAAVGWLYESQNVTKTGGSAFAYHLVRGWQSTYPETTGYIIPTLYDHADHTSTSEPRERAERMAEWLLTLQNHDGSFPGYDDPREGGGDPTVFDTGQIVLGLTRAAEETGDDRYREATAAACDWLADNQDPDGYWVQQTYNERRHAYVVRVAWALLRAADALGEPRYRDAAVANFRWTTTRQRDNGWFEECAFTPDEEPFLHTIAYTVRGLLEGGIGLGNETFLDAARKTADRLLSIQNHKGILKGEYDADWEPASYYCLTGNAQMAVVWYRLYQHGGEERYRVAARRTLEFLKAKQRSGDPPQTNGAIRGSHPVWGRYLPLQFPNWATKFLADALHLAATVDPA